MLDLFCFSEKLSLVNGIWFPISKNICDVSYPKEASDSYFSVEDRSFWFLHRNKIIISAIKRFPSVGEVFDVGGGNGFVSSRIQEEGFPVVLVEPSLDAIRNASIRGVKKLVCSSFEEAEFKDNSIPAVGLFDVLEHVENDKMFLYKINKAIIPSGKIYITVPSYNFLWSNEDEYAGHFRRYTLKKINSLLKSVGLNILFESYFFSSLVLPIFLLRTIPSKINFSRKKNSNSSLRKDHSAGFFSKYLNLFLKKELNKIRKGENLKFGTSFLIVASKGGK